MSISNNYFAIPTIVALTLFSVNARSDCPQDPASIVQPGGTIFVTGEPGISYGDGVLENGSVHDSVSRASTFRDRYDGNSVVRYSSDISLNDQERFENPKDDFGNSTMGCMEEVIVQGVKLVTSSGIFWYFSTLSTRYFNNVTGGGGDQPGDPLPKAPQSPGNVNNTANCGSMTELRRAHADKDIDIYLGAMTVWTRMQQTGEQVWVSYNNGDSEIWTITNPSLGTSHTAGSLPVENSCKSG